MKFQPIAEISKVEFVGLSFGIQYIKRRGTALKENSLEYVFLTSKFIFWAFIKSESLA